MFVEDVTLALGFDLTGTDAVDNLTGTNTADRMQGLSGNDILIGGDGDDVLDGGAGADTMTGGLGNDIYSVDTTGDKTLETSTLITEIDTVKSSVNRALAANLENLILTGIAAINGTGNALNNILTGNDANNGLNGGDGNDTLDGGAGVDTLTGGLGNDVYIVDNTGDKTNETSTLATEIDMVQSSVARTLTANLENLVLTGIAEINGTGNALNNILTGNSANNGLNGGDGNDTLDGGAGVDTLIGGLGNDVYIVDNIGDKTNETSTLATDIDTVQSSVSRTLGANLENLTLTGIAAINGTGNALNNILTGNSANNGLNGGGGNDTLDGSAGVDILTGGLGNDVYIVDDIGDKTNETSTLPTEIDTVQSSVSWTLTANLENLVLTGTTAINGTGNVLDNVLTGNSANNRLNGGDGNDSLNGGADADTMVGGLGNDVYFVDNGGDVVTETSSLATEIDAVHSSISLSLGVNLENLVLTGAASINGFGNGLNNTLIGNGGNNLLNGGNGKDTLTGGLGNDSFRFTGLTQDKITDYSIADDTLQLENSMFTKLTTTGVLSASNFVIASTAQDGDDFVIYDSTTGGLSYDSDGNGAAAAAPIALLGVGLALTHADFVVT
ncbi:MAG: calcium-binding protein [Methylococcaceae bacterium]|nr:calcium-binding protein [Methylococcaceae bacterium]